MVDIELKNNNLLNLKLNPIPTDQYPTAAKRPKYSVMETIKIYDTFRLDVPNWEESLISCLQKI